LTLLLGGGAVAAGYVVGLGLKVPKAANAAWYNCKDINIYI
jgi:hypothetical protein